MDSAHWQLPLLISAIAFAALLVFKTRPMVSAVATPDGRVAAAALKQAQARVAAAKDDAARALALCDAADASARLGKTSSAAAFYMRALRADPSSKAIVERAAAALARRPGALENLMWRHLGGAPWTGEGREAAIASLRALAGVYARKKRTHARARAIENALAALTSTAPSRDGA